MTTTSLTTIRSNVNRYNWQRPGWLNKFDCAKVKTNLLTAIKTAALIVLHFLLFISTPISPALYTWGFLYGIIRADSVHDDLKKIVLVWEKNRLPISIATTAGVMLAWHWIFPIGACLIAAQIGSRLDRQRRGVQN